MKESYTQEILNGVKLLASHFQPSVLQLRAEDGKNIFLYRHSSNTFIMYLQRAIQVKGILCSTPFVPLPAANIVLRSKSFLSGIFIVISEI